MQVEFLLFSYDFRVPLCWLLRPRVTLGNLGRPLSAEKQGCIVLAKKARVWLVLAQLDVLGNLKETEAYKNDVNLQSLALCLCVA